jgi:O-phospho-L-seryl-tRNASec:L-selenocysteinyl-tRNA synthase
LVFDASVHCIFHRVVAPGTTKVINGYEFPNWGSHSNEYPCAYLTAAAAIGMTKDEVDTFLKRLDKCLHKCLKTEDPIVAVGSHEKEEKDATKPSPATQDTVVNR